MFQGIANNVKGNLHGHTFRIKSQPGTPKKDSTGVVPLVAEKVPVVVVSGGERQADRRPHRSRPMMGGDWLTRLHGRQTTTALNEQKRGAEQG